MAEQSSVRSNFEALALTMPKVEEFATKIASMVKMQAPEPVSVATQDDLIAVLRQHAIWLGSLAEPSLPVQGQRACLRGADLRGLTLAAADLRGADLSGANLEGVSLRGAQLCYADLTQANLQRADLTDAKVAGALLPGANLGNESAAFA